MPNSNRARDSYPGCLRKVHAGGKNRIWNFNRFSCSGFHSQHVLSTTGLSFKAQVTHHLLNFGPLWTGRQYAHSTVSQGLVWALLYNAVSITWFKSTRRHSRGAEPTWYEHLVGPSLWAYFFIGLVVLESLSGSTTEPDVKRLSQHDG